MADLQILIEVLGKNLAGGALTDVQGDLDKVGQKSATTSQALTGVGTAMTGVGVAGAAMFGAAISAAGDFEKTMSGVKAVMSPDEVDSFGASLEALALKLGKDTAFSAKEAAEGIEQLVKGGIRAEDIMNGAAEATLNLAAAGGVSLPDAAEIASNAMAMFGIKGEGMAHVADLIAGAANASSMEVTDFKFALNQVGAVATTVGLSFDDTATAISVLAAQGLKGSDAGTSLKTMLINLVPQTDKAAGAFTQFGLTTVNTTNLANALIERGINPLNLSIEEQQHQLVMAVTGWSGMGDMTKKQAKAWQEVEKSLDLTNNAFFDANGSVRSFSEISGILKDKLGDLSGEEQILALKTLFGTDAMRAAAIMMRTGAEGADQMAENLNKVTAAQVGAAHMDNLQGALEALSGSFETLQITIGQRFLPLMRDLTEKATGILNGFLTLPEPIQNTAIAIGLVVTAVGLIVGPLLVLAGMLPTLMTGFTLLAAPVAAVAVPVIALTTAIALLSAAWINDWGGIRTETERVWEAIQPVLDTLKETLGLVGESLAELLPDWKSAWDQMGASAEANSEQSTTAGNALIRWMHDDVNPTLKEFQKWWRETWPPVKEFFDNLGGALKIAEDGLNGFQRALNETGLAINRDFVKPLLTELGKLKDAVLAPMMEVGVQIVAGIILGLTGQWPKLLSEIGTRMNALFTGMQKTAEIESPSKRAAREIGTPIAQGIFEGFEQTLDLTGTEFGEALLRAMHETTRVAEEGITSSPAPYQRPIQAIKKVWEEAHKANQPALAETFTTCIRGATLDTADAIGKTPAAFTTPMGTLVEVWEVMNAANRVALGESLANLVIGAAGDTTAALGKTPALVASPMVTLVTIWDEMNRANRTVLAESITEMTVGAITDSTQAIIDASVAQAREAQAAVNQIRAETTQTIGGGGSAYMPGGIAGAAAPGGLGLTGGGAGRTTQGAGEIGGSGARNQFGFTEWVAGTGSAYPGSGLSAWRQNAPPVLYPEMYGGTYPYNTSGNYPGSTIANRVVGPTTAGPTGTSGPSYGPDATLLAQWGGLLNATIGLGIETPEQAIARRRQEEASAAVAGGNADRLVINQTNNVYGTDPASFATAADNWLDRAQWQAGIA